MPAFDFGQPTRGVMQMAYICDDIEVAMKGWTRELGVGPWFLLDDFTGVDPMYRGNPCRAHVKLAMAFAGHMQIELIQPSDQHPSVYREAYDARGWGFHHYGYTTSDFDGGLADYTSRGYEVAFQCGVPTGGSVAYLDTTGVLPGYVELIEATPVMEATFTRFWKASIGWDGSDPVRPFT